MIAILAMFSMVVVAILLITSIISILYKWVLFNKVGKPGWYAIIPFYNGYTMYSIPWNGAIYFVELVLKVIHLMVCRKLGNRFSIMLLLLAGVLGLILVGIHLIFCYKMTEAFNRGIKFLILLILFKDIGMLILAFGSSVYVGKAGVYREDSSNWDREDY